MKKKFIYILFSAALISGCSKDFTDLNPLSQRNVAAFYKTSDDMIIATNAAYKSLQMDGAYNQSYWMMNEIRSDNTDGGADNTGLGANLAAIDNFIENAATAELITNSYLDTYVGINRCNTVLSRIDAVEMDATLKNRLKGENLFLRSLFYYNLAVNFGRVPLVLKEISVDEGKSYVQSPATEIYNQLVKDLTTAEGFLPIKYTGGDVGRATKGAAATLLGKIYLTLGNKTAAVAPLRRVKDYGYSLVPNYTNIWGIANENNVESIFEVQYKGGGTNTGNGFTNAFTPLLRQTTGGYKNRPTAEMEAAYEAGDARKAASMNPINGPLNAGRFILKYGTVNPNNENDADYNFIVLRYADAMLMLAEALGEGTESYDLINAVRRRAGLTNDISAATPGTFADKLLKERRVELAFENHRWPDLLRFGKANDFMTAQGKKARLLFLIPQRELDINSTYTQNPL